MRRVRRDEQRRMAVHRELHRQRSRGSGLADAALTADEDEPVLLVGQQIVPRVGVCAAEGLRGDVLQREDTPHLEVEEGQPRERELTERGRAVEPLELAPLLGPDAVQVCGGGGTVHDLVDDHVRDRHALVGESRQQPRALSDGEARGDADDDEVRHVFVGEQLAQRGDAVSPALEARDGGLDLVGGVVASQHALEQADGGEEARLERHDLAEKIVEELWKGEQPQRMAGGRRVEDDAVKACERGCAVAVWLCAAHDRQRLSEGQ
mmetsp:Transcript_35724/g.114877  ORF Transcript_35724/g.114877 Transcript_35724/m.114877 type:complete len:265 (+) Transcript_35724:1180-1974(+)